MNKKALEKMNVAAKDIGKVMNVSLSKLSNSYKELSKTLK